MTRTKRQCLNRYFEIMEEVFKQDILERLNSLVKADRVTSGAAYYIYSPYEWYGYKAISTILQKANSSKDILRYLKRVSKFYWNYYIQDMERQMKETMAFIQEQETIEFEKSQKQVLKAKGELTTS
ncbi:MAG: hypothetical protein WDA47_03785 [Bacilli bacterium]